MNDLDKIKTPKKKPKKIKRYLKDIDLDHIAMTSGMGAASEMNEPFILKSVEKSSKDENTYTEEETGILKELGEWKEEYITIKSVSKTTDILNEAEENPNIKEEQKEKETTMSKQNDGVVETPVVSVEELDALRQEVMKMKKENEILKSNELIKDFIFSNDEDKQKEIKKGVAEIISTIEFESREILTKAFNAAIKHVSTKAVEKAKSEDKKPEENTLKKMLDEEVGSEDGEDKDALLKGNPEGRTEVDKFNEDFTKYFNKSKGIKEDNQEGK